MTLNIFLGTTFFDEQILATLSEKRKITVHGSGPVAIIRQGNKHADAVSQDMDTKEVNSETV